MILFYVVRRALALSYFDEGALYQKGLKTTGICHMSNEYNLPDDLPVIYGDLSLDVDGGVEHR